MRKFAFLVTIILLCCGWTHGLFVSTQFTLPLKIGAGGWLVGMDINPDGTRMVRADAYGAYLWNGSSWDQLVTQSRWPAAYFGMTGSGTTQQNMNSVGSGGGGAYEVTSAPSNSSVMYIMISGWIFKSTDKGATFNVTGSGAGTGFNSSISGTPDPVPMASNAANRQCGRKMAVDPVNPSIVLAGTDTRGMFITTNGGSLWSAVGGGLPTGTGIINYSIAFDPSSSTGGATPVAYAFTNGATAGVYKTTDGGATWALTTSGPTAVCHLIVTSNGTVWATNGSNGDTNGNLWRYAGGTWLNFTALNASFHAVAVDPTNNARIVATSAGGALNSTLNGNDPTPTWTGLNTLVRAATDIPWLALANEFSMSVGDIMFDPTLSNTLVMSAGIGVWTTNPVNSTAQITYTSISSGIEELVSRSVIAPNGIPVVAVEDRTSFYRPNPNAYDSTINTTYGNGYSLMVGQDLDFAKSNTQYMAINAADTTGVSAPNISLAGSSSDGGNTWRMFNSFYQELTVSATNVANNGGLVRLTLPTTFGLTTWINGVGSIVRVMGLDGAYNGTIIRRYFPVTVVDGTHIDLQNSTFNAVTQSCISAQFASCRYAVYVDTTPLTSNNKLYNVTATANDSGMVKLTVTSTSSGMIDGTRVCVSGVGGTVEANGCWVSTNTNNGTNSFSLFGSAFANAFTSGGVAAKAMPAGGSLAVSTPLNMIISGGGYDYPQCTTDGGQTWSELTVPAGVAAGGNTGWVTGNGYTRRKPYAADFVAANTIYMYNDSGSAAATYKVVNCVVQSSPPTTRITNGNLGGTLRSVPGYSGHLFFGIGPQGSTGIQPIHPGGGALRWSLNEGSAWNSIANTAEPRAIAVGAVAPGSDYPTVYMAGWVSNVYGIWRTSGTLAQWQSGSNTGANLTWTNVINGATCTANVCTSSLNQYALGYMDTINTIGADMTQWNRWYMGYGGSGFVYGQQNFLLKRDIDPASNDNDPMWLGKAA